MSSSQPQHHNVAVHGGISGLAEDAVLTGAETVALILAEHDAETVFAYAGTSELALCDAVEAADRLRLVNARGDKECVFMAARAAPPPPHRRRAPLAGR